MKKTLMLLGACVALCCQSALAIGFVHSDAQSARLRGPVKRVSVYQLHKSEYYHADTIAKYKRLGKPLPQFERDLDEVADYDRQGRKTRVQDAVFGSENVYEYGFPGHVAFTRNITSYRDGDGRVYTVKLDAMGLPTGGTAVDKTGKLIFTETVEQTKGADGGITLLTSHKNADGRVTVSAVELRPDLTMKTLKHGATYRFDEQERPLEFISGNGKKHSVSEYVADGCKYYTVGTDGSRTLERIVTNDKYGNPIEEKWFNPDGTENRVIEYEYQYDSHGNWTRRAKLEGAGQHITERVIEYY